MFGDPNTVYVLFTAGMLALMAGLYPVSLPLATSGGLALLLAAIGFTNVSPHWPSLVSVAAGLAVVGLGAPRPFGRVMLLAGTCAVLIGSLVLFESARVHPALVVGVATVSVAWAVLMQRAAERARTTPPKAGREALVGSTGIATSELAPQGVIKVDGALWTGIADKGPIHVGDAVEVTAVQGVRLRVRRVS